MIGLLEGIVFVWVESSYFVVGIWLESVENWNYVLDKDWPKGVKGGASYWSRLLADNLESMGKNSGV